MSNNLDFCNYQRINDIMRRINIQDDSKIDFACISDIRYSSEEDEYKDISIFGYSHEKFRVKPLNRYTLKTSGGNIKGQLFMVGIKSCDIANNLSLARELVIEAIKQAMAKGAKIILLAANTKAIFGRGVKGRKSLNKFFPGILFLLGDNLVVHFILKQMEISFQKNSISPKKAKVLIVAPRGLIASNLIQPLKDIGCSDITGLLNPEKGKRGMEKIGKELKIKTINSFNHISGVDLVITGGFQSYYRLNMGIIKKIKKNRSKLIVLDHSEPTNMSVKEVKKNENSIFYLKTGNGYNQNLEYVLGDKAATILGLINHHTWGCFSETICIAYLAKTNPEILSEDWFGVFPEKVKQIGDIAEQLGFSPSLL